MKARMGRRIAAAVFAFLAVAAGAPAPAFAETNASAPAPAFASTIVHAESLRAAPGSIPATLLRLEAIDPSEVDAAKRANATRWMKPLQLGIGRAVDGRAEAEGDALAWRAVAGGIAETSELLLNVAMAKTPCGRNSVPASVMSSLLDRNPITAGTRTLPTK